MNKWLIFGMIIMALIASTIGLAKKGMNWPQVPSPPSKHLNEEQIVAGLKEALQIGVKNAADLTGRPNGYFGNPVIKILMPEKLQKLEKALRKIGDGNEVDDFVLSMNQAAERSAPAAKRIFWDAIKGMSFDDARKIWQGDDTAATQYFRGRTSEELARTFLPMVRQATNEVGVTHKYKELVTKAKAIPFLKNEMVDIDQYVVLKALDGLFYTVGEEEKKIRKDPVARVTDILKQVFGNR